MAAGWAKGSSWVILSLGHTQNHSQAQELSFTDHCQPFRGGIVERVGHLIMWPSICSAHGSPEPRAFRKLGILKVDVQR